MAQQIAIAEHVVVGEDLDDGSVELDATLAYLRLAIVNVVLHGPRQAGDRGWVLIDAGVAGSKETIERTAAARFGRGARPSAIVLTHGHFDHVGALEALAADWDAPVYAHPLEHGYLDGTRAYPPAHPTIQDGLMSLLSPLYPRGPIDIGIPAPAPASGRRPPRHAGLALAPHPRPHTGPCIALARGQPHPDRRRRGDHHRPGIRLRGCPPDTRDPRPAPVLHDGLGCGRTIGARTRRPPAEDAGHRPRSCGCRAGNAGQARATRPRLPSHCRPLRSRGRAGKIRRGCDPPALPHCSRSVQTLVTRSWASGLQAWEKTTGTVGNSSGAFSGVNFALPASSFIGEEWA